MLDTPRPAPESPPVRHDDRVAPHQAADDKPSPSDKPGADTKAAAPPGNDQAAKPGDAPAPKSKDGCKDAKAGDKAGDQQHADDAHGTSDAEPTAVGIATDAVPDATKAATAPQPAAPAAPIAAPAQPSGEVSATADPTSTAGTVTTGPAPSRTAPTVAVPTGPDAAKGDKAGGAEPTIAPPLPQGATSASPTEPEAQPPDGPAALSHADPHAVTGKHAADADAASVAMTETRIAATPQPRPSRVSIEALGHSGDATVKSAADAVQNLNLAVPANQTAITTNLANPAPADATVPLAGLAVAIAHEAQAGKNRFEIRLDPPDLGRIDVRLDVDRDGNVSSRLIVERQDTLDLLRRDASQLERALQQAGLKTSDNTLEFSLRGQAFSRDNETPQNVAHLVIPEDDAAPLELVRHGYGRLLGLGSGVDIRV